MNTQITISIIYTICSLCFMLTIIYILKKPQRGFRYRIGDFVESEGFKYEIIEKWVTQKIEHYPPKLRYRLRYIKDNTTCNCDEKEVHKIKPPKKRT